MSKSAVILFAYGFEEVEALTVYDGLVRAGVKVVASMWFPLMVLRLSAMIWLRITKMFQT